MADSIELLEAAANTLDIQALLLEVERGEFEDLDDYRIRLNSVIPADTQYLDTKVVPSRAYDIEKKLLPLEIAHAFLTPKLEVEAPLSIWGRKHRNRGFIMNDFILLQLDDESERDTYVGTNAFGATAEVDKVRGTTYFLVALEPELGRLTPINGSSRLNVSQIENGFGLHIEPSEAKAIREGKETLRLRLGFRLCNPSESSCVIEASSVTSPTIENKLDIHKDLYAYVIKLEEIVVYRESDKRLFEHFTLGGAVEDYTEVYFALTHWCTNIDYNPNREKTTAEKIGLASWQPHCDNQLIQCNSTSSEDVQKLKSCMGVSKVNVHLENRFNPFEVSWVRGKGTATVQGKAFTYDNTGKKQTCAGEKVSLVPVADYSSERIGIIYGTNEGGNYAGGHVLFEEQEGDEEYLSYTLTANCSGSGKFKFKNILQGQYFLLASVNGAAIMRRISVEQGQKHEFDLKP